MGLETATWIEDLVDTNPTPEDKHRQGDDHFRLVKSVLQNQFPNLGPDALTVSAEEVNFLNGLSQDIQTSLNDKADTSVLAGYAQLDVAQAFTKAQRVVPGDLGVVQGVVTADLNLSNMFHMILAGNITLNVSNLADGKSVAFNITANGHVVTFGAPFVFPEGVAPVFSSGEDTLSGFVKGTQLRMVHTRNWGAP